MEISRFSLTNELYTKLQANAHSRAPAPAHTNAQSTVPAKAKVKAPLVTTIIPKETDKLFWCFYILHKGQDAYSMVKNQHFTIEKQMKIDFVKVIRDNKPLLKTYHLKKCEVENELVNESVISLKVFYLFCIYYEIDVIYLSNKFYYELDQIFNPDVKPFLICNKNGTYFIETETQNLDFFRLNMCKMDNISRYIKPMSGYKLTDIHDLALKLNISIDDGKRKTKQQIYNELLIAIN